MNYKMKFAAIFTACLFLLTSCVEELPEETINPSEEGTASCEASLIETNKEHDKAWWWNNYIADYIMYLDTDYPSDNLMTRYYQEFKLLTAAAIKNNDCKISDDKDPHAVIKREDLEKNALEALGKEDISYLDTEFLEDEYGTFSVYSSAITREKHPEEYGNLRFEVTEVNCTDDKKAVITVSMRQREGNFTFKENSLGSYTLEAVKWTEEEKKPIEYICDQEHYHIRSSDSNFRYNESIPVGLIDDTLYKMSSDDTYLGLVEFSSFDIASIEAPKNSFLVKLEKSEHILPNSTKIENGYIILPTTKTLKKIDPKTGEIINSKPLTANFSNQYDIYGKLWGTKYIWDENLQFISYCTPDGIFLDDIDSDTSFTVCYVPMDNIHIYGGAFKIQDGLLYYYTDRLNFSYDDYKCFDIKSMKEVPCPFMLPPSEDNISYSHRIGNKFIGEPSPFLESDTGLAIYDYSTGNIIKSKEPTVNIFDDPDSLYILKTKILPSGLNEYKLMEVNLETGVFSEPVITMEASFFHVDAIGEKIVINYSGIIDGYEKGVIVINNN